MKFRTLVATATIGGITLYCLANPVSAGEFSIGASAAHADVEVSDGATAIGGDANGWRVFGLYMFNDNFGIETGFSSLGEPDDNRIPADMEVETEGYDVYAVGYYPMSEKLGLIGKAGVATWDTETEVGDDDSTEVRYTSTDLALSFGGQYDVSERIAIRGEYQWFGRPGCWRVDGAVAERCDSVQVTSGEQDMKTRHYGQWAAMGTLLLTGLAAWADEGEEDVPLADVPAAVMQAAAGAVEGVKITEAEVEMEDGKKIYELEGTANGVEYEIEVSEDGEVLSVEEDD